ncbi:hypothetical protein VF14_19625 [Nostoc linckia z18]|uniref:Uncharacterized protein n=2 Tax=Nostoc linckia TaxID=92942 RepID=A0A9Q5ZDA1_NOSLI|nr:hypothetical protein VF02_14980 [Nostoc linckia z1]PHJ68528.1 hypothetical protein VF05_15670 [Nostoc linckia z3]PHJ74297.1 hypothetical protein VF03_14805 [Nostoc linckia z2]PHJ80360.1 hypothetical protein VF06_23040 [Nostoc linckia z4]PHJ87834.1 hypothetical protein VF07_18785 [Nostoc linckia z6]PHJ98113.1 hypothetical protein VF04_10715 [Nostoc linckia z7]PHK04430.1 hypothetical protein VF08_11510 [Nostoc linckia z8]PHK04968.1 hypothetical protein VF09_27665 [Nostoc linckia z9]PHK1734
MYRYAARFLYVSFHKKNKNQILNQEIHLYQTTKLSETATGLNKASVTKPDINLDGMFHPVPGKVAIKEAMYFLQDDKIYKKV